MDDDSGKIWTLILQINYVVKMDDRLHYVCLSSNVKQPRKRDEKQDSATIDSTKMHLVVK